jgi:hypothetical protein
MGTTAYGREYLTWAGGGYQLADDPRSTLATIPPSPAALRRRAKARTRGALGWVTRTLAGEWVAGCLARGCLWSGEFTSQDAAQDALTVHARTDRSSRDRRQDLPGRGAA